MTRAPSGRATVCEVEVANDGVRPEPLPLPPAATEGRVFVDRRVATTHLPMPVVFAAIEGLGGVRGWLFANTLWWLRGVLDWCIGGPGLGRGRRDQEHLEVGSVVDCWRVAALERPKRLVLWSEMRMPGEGWLSFAVEAEGEGSRIVQTATYIPRGLWGWVYWGAMWPFHQVLFPGLLRNLLRVAGGEQWLWRRRYGGLVLLWSVVLALVGMLWGPELGSRTGLWMGARVASLAWVHGALWCLWVAGVWGLWRRWGWRYSLVAWGVVVLHASVMAGFPWLDLRWTAVIASLVTLSWVQRRDKTGAALGLPYAVATGLAVAIGL